MLIRRIARPLLAATFLAEGVESLLHTKESAAAAAPTIDKGLEILPVQVSESLPTNTEALVRINAAVQIGGGALLATGKFPRIASLALAGTLVPAQIGSHAFWNETDPRQKAQQRREFFTGVSLLGGLLITAVDTEGKPSLSWRGRRAARRTADAVSGVLPTSGPSDSAAGEYLAQGLHAATERGKVIAGFAAQHSSELAEIARGKADDYRSK